MDSRKLSSQLNSQLSSKHRAIIFDFDGVLADSEVLSNTVIADVVTELGKPTTVDDAYRTFMGKRLSRAVWPPPVHWRRGDIPAPQGCVAASAR